jgi:hypothetical protein
MDDDMVPATLSAALAHETVEANATQEVGVGPTIAHLLATRNLSARRATTIALTGKCDECRCLVGEQADQDECECPCHCKCCCPPLFHCMKQCQCDCHCHYKPTSDDEADVASSSDDESKDESKSEASITLGQATPVEASGDLRGLTASRTAARATGKRDAAAEQSGASPRRPIDGGISAGAGLGHASDTDDDMVGTAPLTVDPGQLTVAQLTELLGQQLQRTDEQAELNGKQVLQALFTANYEQASKGRRSDKSPNQHLPILTESELDQLHGYVLVLHAKVKTPPHSYQQ